MINVTPEMRRIMVMAKKAGKKADVEHSLIHKRKGI